MMGVAAKASSPQTEGTIVDILQTGQEVAIKKINLGDVREVTVPVLICCPTALT
jgi:hypothetical protein